MYSSAQLIYRALKLGDLKILDKTKTIMVKVPGHRLL
jgi:hypothetical protein